MYNRRKQRHFLSHTLEHLFGVFIVLMVSAFVGYVASAADPDSTLLTSTDSIAPSSPIVVLGTVSTSNVGISWQGAIDNVGITEYKIFRNGNYLESTAQVNYFDGDVLQAGQTYVYTVRSIDAVGNESLDSNGVSITIPATSALVSPDAISLGSIPTVDSLDVYFSAQLAPVVSCEDGIPLTPVFLLATRAEGGNFLLSSDTGMSNVRMEWGEYSLPNGHYSWRASLQPGFVGAGALSGSFSINNKCEPAVEPKSSPSGYVGTTFQDPAPIETLESDVVPQIFVRDTLLPSGSAMSGDFTLSIVLNGATRVTFTLVNSSNTTWYDSDKGEVTQVTEGGRWSRIIPAGALPPDTYTASVNFEAMGKSYVTQSIEFTIKNPQSGDVVAVSPAVESSSLQPLTRPLLRLFVDNEPRPGTESFDDEDIEFRITTAIATDVTVVLIDTSGKTRVLGRAIEDDLLSRPGIDVYTLIWSPEEFPNGSIRVGAVVKHEDGRETQSERMNISISHAASLPTPLYRTNPQTETSVLQTSVQVTREEEVAIRARIADPASCENAEECRIYCASQADVKRGCVSYAQTPILYPPTPARPSLADGVSDLRLASMLSDNTTRSKEIPDIVETVNEFRQYCADLNNTDVCSGILVRGDLKSPDNLLAQTEVMKLAGLHERMIFTERIGARAFLDTDQDGVTDYDEVNLYKTNPNVSDTDGDGFQDGAEILARTNPLGGFPIQNMELDSPDADIEFSGAIAYADESVGKENPFIAGLSVPELLQVNNVTVTDTALGNAGLTVIKSVKLEGHSSPNSFVTIYVFSEPIIVTVKADQSGSWSYLLKRELSDGTHHVFGAITDANGHILAKSGSLSFIKQAGSVAVLSINGETDNSDTTPFDATFYAILALVIGIIGIILSITGFVIRKHDKSPFTGFPSI